MKFVRFEKDETAAYGIASEEMVRTIKGSPFAGYSTLDERYSLSDVRLLAPCTPSKIIAIGLNYRTHAEEVRMQVPDEPLLFMKPSTAVIGPEDTILYPAMSRRVDYEAELAVVIGRSCRNTGPENASDYILGYTCFNDVTARDLQKKDGQFTRSKSFDTFAPVGPWIETDLDPDNVRVESFLNGEPRQSGSTRDLIFPVPCLVSFISRVMTLNPGDIIATGTPSGIGPMQEGDVIEISVEGIGTLKNTVSGGVS